MNLSELRAEARRIQRQTKGIYALFFSANCDCDCFRCLQLFFRHLVQ